MSIGEPGEGSAPPTDGPLSGGPSESAGGPRPQSEAEQAPCEPWRKYKPRDLLPHGEGFLFVDDILEYSKARLVAMRRFPLVGFWGESHFPGNPLVPGVLLLEGLAQTAGLHIRVAQLQPGGRVLTPEPGYLAEIGAVRFTRAVRPGAVVTYVARRVARVDRLYAYETNASVDGQVVVTATVKLFVGDLDADPVGPPQEEHAECGRHPN